MDEAAVRRDLLAWYRRAARDLPWRRPARAADPYAVWVSEVMLQQTRVDVAAPYYERWMARLPTVQALAAADPEEVLRLWSGLGYYSRARKLHEAARLVAAQGGRLPDTAAGLRGLPGIGPYTAGAIASMAFGRREPAVDGNVVRVLARLHGWPGAASSRRLLARVQAAAERLVPERRPGDWNQALMDLGATVCTPRAPRCAACPVAAHCAARQAGRQHLVPAPKRKAAPRREAHAFAVVRRADGRLLLVRNPGGGLLAGLWTLPGGPASRPLAEHVLEQAGVRVRPHGRPATARHLFSHRAWHMEVDVADLLQEGAAPPARETAWLADDALAGEALPAAMRTALAAAGVATAGSRPGPAAPMATVPRSGKAKSRKGSGRP